MAFVGALSIARCEQNVCRTLSVCAAGEPLRSNCRQGKLRRAGRVLVSRGDAMATWKMLNGVVQETRRRSLSPAAILKTAAAWGAFIAFVIVADNVTRATGC
jgi:hypothetical protein